MGFNSGFKGLRTKHLGVICHIVIICNNEMWSICLGIYYMQIKSLIRPVVSNGCEAWTLTNRDEQYLRIFERRILRKIFGPVQNEDGF